MRTSTIARAIERYLLQDDTKPNSQAAVHCHACGRSYLYREPEPEPDSDASSRFCSSRCREAYDAGVPAHDSNYSGKSNPRWYSLPMGARGFLIDCAGCGKRFDSTGLRCCSPECERTYRERQEIDRLLADASFRAAKRKCEECDRDIPNWR